MAVTQYIGARYIPVLADPPEWNDTREYEPLTVVLYQGDTYISRQAVPIGAQITNANFWLHAADYNAQIAQYRNEVYAFDARITQNAADISSEVSARTTADTALDGRITQNATDISDEVSARTTADTALDGRITQNATDISNETTARIAADAALDARITQNATDISNETTARIDSDMQLASSISSEEAARIEADNVLSHKISSIFNNTAISSKKIVVIGDSLTSATGATVNWPTVIKNEFMCEVYNYATPKQGIITVANGGNFTTQLDRAVADSSFNNNEVTDVIIMGGFNDYMNDATQLQTATTALCNAARTSFPNAVIHVGAMLKGVNPLDWANGGASTSQNRSLLIAPIQSGALAAYSNVIPHPWNWLMPYPNTATDTVHVNNDGQQVIARNVISYLKTGQVPSFRAQKITRFTGNVVDHGTFMIVTDGETVTLSGSLTTTSADNNSQVYIFDLPPWAHNGGNTAYGMNMIGAGGYHNKNASTMRNAGSNMVISGDSVMLGYTYGSADYWFNASWPYGI